MDKNSKHDRHILNANQLVISNKLKTEKLHALKRRAERRVNYFTTRVKELDSLVDKHLNEQGYVISSIQYRAHQARKKLVFWEHRLNKMHDLLAERILLNYDTESNN